jgi:hypothetical protein
MVPGGVGGVWANPVDHRNAKKTAKERAVMFMAAISKLATKKAGSEKSRHGDRRVKKPREHDRDGL